MIPSYKAFLSCSSADSDKDVVAFFQKLLNSLAIEVGDSIAAGDCLVTIATKGGGGQMQQDFALAAAQKKPVAIFVEDGVPLTGPIITEPRRLVFQRDRLLDDVDKIVGLLFDLRHAIESPSRTVSAILKHYIRERVTIADAKTAIERCDVLLECLADGPTDHLQLYTLKDTTPGLDVDPKDFQFTCLSKPDGMKVSAVPEPKSDPRRHFWTAVFEPGLKKGDRIRFAYRIERSNPRPYTRGEMQRRIDDKTYGSTIARVTASEWIPGYPTVELDIRVDFPAGYDLSDPSYDVRTKDTGIVNEQEAKRLEQAKCFTAERIFDKWTLALKVGGPLQDYCYGLYFVPPIAG